MEKVYSTEIDDRIAALEARLAELEARMTEVEKSEAQNSSDGKSCIAELEARLCEAEQKEKKAKQLAVESVSQVNCESSRESNITASDVLESSAKELWTREGQWDEIKPGVSIEKVLELLGPPLRSLDSLKPRVDEVFYYQSSLRATSVSLRGKISFRNGKVLTVEKPNFKFVK